MPPVVVMKVRAVTEGSNSQLIRSGRSRNQKENIAHNIFIKIEIMLIVLYMLSCLTLVKADSHSLMLFATYINGQTQFPEFSAVVLLDDLQLMFYDSVTGKLVHRRNSTSDYYEDEQMDAKYIFEAIFIKMKEQTSFFKDRLNYTDGFPVFQTVAGCEWLDDDKSGMLLLRDAFNGLSNEEWLFNMAERSWIIKTEWATNFKQITLKLAAENVLRVICVKHLQRYLHMEKNCVLRKVKPRVRVFKKTLTDSGGAMITCLATGFYPRHINLTLLRNGKPVLDHEIMGGDLLPNADGTYQMRKSLEIPAEKIGHNYNFTCTATHLSLDNKLAVKMELENYQGSSTVAVISCLLVVVCVTALVITALMWKKRRTAESLATLHCKALLPLRRVHC
ncbi:DLA class I histocompatibility antigen, A9/A9 alpha chain-like isoform X2 [Paramisgurnus dabryanus]|uniref:DLA class I histocompatibility antigen, A9/A9 alpha chain-like isoform X2 n=1 Tax=Paramisgurnus dabryanus TaxID=90735 RepID=UPI003CCF9DAD